MGTSPLRETTASLQADLQPDLARLQASRSSMSAPDFMTAALDALTAALIPLMQNSIQKLQEHDEKINKLTRTMRDVANVSVNTLNDSEAFQAEAKRAIQSISDDGNEVKRKLDLLTAELKGNDDLIVS